MYGILRGLFYRREERDDGASVIYPRVQWSFLFPCNHSGPSTYTLVVHGRTFSNKVLDPKGDGPCADCAVDDFIKRLIYCVNCGGLITPGQMVAIVIAEPGDATKPGIHLMTGGKEVIMCCGPGCHHGDFTGWWNGEGVDRPKI